MRGGLARTCSLTSFGRKLPTNKIFRNTSTYEQYFSFQGQAAAERIKTLSKNPNVFVRRLDVSDLKSVRSFAKEFKDDFKELHVLINNAGMAGDLGHRLYGMREGKR